MTPNRILIYSTNILKPKIQQYFPKKLFKSIKSKPRSLHLVVDHTTISYNSYIPSILIRRADVFQSIRDVGTSVIESECIQ